MKHLFFFPFPWLSLLRLGAPKLQNPRRNCLGNKEPFLHRFCASPKCGNALKTRTTPKPNKRRCQKSGVRFKQTYKRHIPKMSKGTKERHQRPGGRWCDSHSSQRPCWGRHSNPRARFNSLSNLSLHTRRWISRPLIFDSIRTSKLLQKMTWRHSFDINFCTSSNIIQNIYPCYSISGYYPLIISTQKIEVVNSPIHWLFLYAPYFFLWSRLTQEPPGWNGNPLPPMSPSPTLSMPSPWRFFVVTVRRWER